MTSSQAVAIRKALGINKAGFARLLGVGTASVARWESGDQPDAVLLGSTAEVLAAFERALAAGGSATENARRVAMDAQEGRSGLGILIEKMLRRE